jgi:hypothetical protein
MERDRLEPLRRPACIIGLAAALVSAAAAAVPADLDLAFGAGSVVAVSLGVGGSVTVSFDVTLPGGYAGTDIPSGIALLPDGRFVVAGGSYGPCGPGGCAGSALVMARSHPDGNLDASFGLVTDTHLWAANNQGRAH